MRPSLTGSLHRSQGPPCYAVGVPAQPVFRLICPRCGDLLQAPVGETRRCPRENREWRAEAGIWRLLTDADRARHQSFLRQYERVRETEGWGSDDPAFYRALPFEDRSGRYPDVWRIRAQSYRALHRRILRRMVRAHGPELRIVDLGAGNGWLSHRLANAGHRVAALDVNTDDRDGLGALARYAEPGTILSIEAGFEHLPVADDEADLLIFNGSFHYSADYRATLSEALRVLRLGGRIVLMDTPYYQRDDDGAQMLQEQREARRSAGDGADWFTGKGFLTPVRLSAICSSLDLGARVIRPPAAWRAAVATLKARALRRRARAAFPLIELAPKRA